MIQAVLFDFYDTLGKIQTERVLAARRELAHRAGVPEEAFFDAWRATFQARSLGQLGPLEQELATVLGQLGRILPQEQLTALADFERATWRAAVQLYPDTRPTLAVLRQQGLRLGLVSNCSCQAAEAIRSLGLAALLDTLVLSCEVGILKPDPGIYLRACEDLGVAPSACAFVGDGGSQELRGAYTLGMLTLRLERAGERNDLAVGQPYHYHLTTLDQVSTVLASAQHPGPP